MKQYNKTIRKMIHFDDVTNVLPSLIKQQDDDNFSIVDHFRLF